MIDPNTGLPQLNPGWEWRVESTSRNDGFRVSLDQVGSRETDPYSKDVEYIFGDMSSALKPQHLVTNADIRNAAEKVLRERAKRERDAITGQQARERLVGSYPPKRLEH